MFQDFANRKVNDYLNLLEFPAGRILFENLRNSSLPQYIFSFIEHYIPNRRIPIEKNDLAEALRKALIFNINYLIRPKYSIMRFLFGNVETRPVEFLKERLSYFQFYGYYTTQIIDFIDINSLEVVTSAQIGHVIDEVNRKVYEEISENTGTDSHRLNLVKLLYYFFHDLGDNNPINIKLPKKILSVFFADKGFMELKTRVDSFFSDEIFIQEAVSIMNPGTKKAPKVKNEVDVTEDKFKEIISRAKSGVINKDSSREEIEKILVPDEEIPEVSAVDNIQEIREKSPQLPGINTEKLVIDEKLYSDDLVFEKNFGDITPPLILTDEEKREKLLADLFCEETYRRKIIKKIFAKRESTFKTFLSSVLTQNNWYDVTVILDNYFRKNKIDFFSEEAVKFVDILQSHFSGPNNSKAV